MRAQEDLPSWTALDSPITDSYDDVFYVSKNKLFYALCNNGAVESWDLTNPSSPKRSLVISAELPRYPPKMDNHHWCVRRDSYARTCLAESSGELLMVKRYESNARDPDMDGKTVAFDVYKRDFVENKWVYVQSLGDRVLFMGQNHSVSLSAHDFPGLRENSIYFTAQSIENSYASHDFGVFNLEDDSIHHSDLKDIQPSPIWVVPDL
ncbi:F-box protein At2g26160-like [Cornus florida]|uniref:F-box protein At2g26160-like n=1 Tax=Cornus florida TaxID=4283 RepID=UPI0028A02A52|nr:F-box protein At2g26160-like [Cornus florida]